MAQAMTAQVYLRRYRPHFLVSKIICHQAFLFCIIASLSSDFLFLFWTTSEYTLKISYAYTMEVTP